jgi:hypothetical protein
MNHITSLTTIAAMDRKWPPGRQSYGAPADGGRLPCAGGRCSGDPERNMVGEGKGTEHPVGHWPSQEPKLEVPSIYKAYVRPM